MEATTASLSTPDSRIATALFAVVFVACAYFFAGGGWNQNAQFDLTRAIVEDRSFAIDRFAHNTGDLAFHDGRVYANKAPGTSFLAAVPYAMLFAVDRVAGIDPSDPLVVFFNAYVCTAVVSGGLAAAVAVLLFAIARSTGRSRGAAVALALVVAFGSLMLPYATVLMAHVPSAALLFAAYAAIRMKRRFLLAGVLAAAAAVTNYLLWPAVALVAVFGAFQPESGRVRRLLRYGAGAALPVALLAFYQQVAFGGIFRTSIEKMDPRFVTEGAAYGIIGTPSLEALAGVTISPYRGLFYVAPVLLLAIPGLVLLARDRAWRADAVLIGAIAGYVLLFNASFNGWEGGFGIGARYLVVLIPFFGVCMMAMLERMRPLWIVLTLISFINCVAATAVDPQPSGSIPRPLEQYVYPLLLEGEFSRNVPLMPPWSPATFTGHTSVNRHSVLEAVPFQRFPPGSPMAEWASFNLGEPFTGAGDLRSLIPFVLWLAAGVAVLVRMSRAPS